MAEVSSAVVEVLQHRLAASLNDAMHLQVENLELRRALDAMTAERDALQVKDAEKPTPIRKSA